MNRLVQRCVVPVLFGIGTANFGEAHSAEPKVPLKAEAVPKVAAAKVERPIRATIREGHLPQLVSLSSSDKFDRVSQWFENLNDKQLEELQSGHSHESLREALIRFGYPDVVNSETTDALLKFFKEPQSQVIVKQLRQLPAKEFKHIQDLAKHALETNSPEARRDLIKAFREAGIAVDPSILVPLYVVFALAAAVMAAAVGVTAILNSKHLSIKSKKKSTHTKLPVVGTGDERDAKSKTREQKPKARPKPPDRNPVPPGPSQAEIAELANAWYLDQKKKKTG